MRKREEDAQDQMRIPTGYLLIYAEKPILGPGPLSKWTERKLCDGKRGTIASTCEDTTNIHFSNWSRLRIEGLKGFFLFWAIALDFAS